MSFKIAHAVAGVVGFSFVQTASAQYQVLLSEQGSNAVVPGVVDPIDGISGTPFHSSNGRYVAIEVAVDDNVGSSNFDNDEVAVLYDLLTGTKFLIAQEDITPSPNGVLGDAISSLDGDFGVNNSGVVVFNADDTGATASNEAIFQYNAGIITAPVREGEPSFIAGRNYGTTASDSPHITNAGVISAEYDLDGSTADDALLATGTTVLSRQGDAPPAGYIPSAGAPVGGPVIDILGDFTVSGNGTHTIYDASTNDDSDFDDYLVVDGVVVLQEETTNITLTDGTTGQYNFPGSSDIADSGDWIHDATAFDSAGLSFGDVVFVNGTVVEQSDTQAPGFAAGVLLDFNNGVTINANGDYVTIWDTNGTAIEDDVMLLNGMPLLFEGDTLSLDLDGDGTASDVVITGFGITDFNLADDGTLFFVGTFSDLSGLSLGDALVAVNINNIPEPASLGVLAAGALLMGRRRRSA